MSKVFGVTSIGIGLTALSAYLTPLYFPDLSLHTFIAACLLQFAIVIILGWCAEWLPKLINFSLFAGMSVLSGYIITGLLSHYTNYEVGVAFIVTTVLFVVLSIMGMVTKKDLTSWGPFLFAALIALIAAMLLNMFLQSTAIQYVISSVAVILFAAFTYHDVAQIKKLEGRKGSVIYGAVNLYLDFINMFIHLLMLIGGIDD